MAGSRRNYLAILNSSGIKKGVKGGSHISLKYTGLIDTNKI